jgi:hypothetical protein
LISVSVGAYIFCDNSDVKLTSYSVYSKKINAAFDGYKIAVISDFHNSNNYEKIIKKVISSNPEILVFIGDIINMDDENYDHVGKLLDGIAPVCKAYFVSGNNETWSTNEEAFLEFLTSKNVVVINNKVIPIEYKNSRINLIGYKDIIYSDDVMRYEILENELDTLYNKVQNKELYDILLFHRGNLFDTVAKKPFDLVLSGHIHGGQINLPFIKDKILMKKFNTTKYSNGYYREGNSQMILSGGLEKNFKNIRLFNTPEVVEVTLKTIK